MQPYIWRQRAKRINLLLNSIYKTEDVRLLPTNTHVDEPFNIYKLIQLVCRYEKWLLCDKEARRINSNYFISFSIIHEFSLDEPPRNVHLIDDHLLITNCAHSLQIRDLDAIEKKRLAQFKNVGLSFFDYNITNDHKLLQWQVEQPQITTYTIPKTPFNYDSDCSCSWDPISKNITINLYDQSIFRE
jgi:hypothetical protein